MPLTPCHAAAAWPVRRMLPALPLAPLVVGTMSPDVEYLIRLAPAGRNFHTPIGIVVFCLPVSLLIVAALDRWIRPALLRRAPGVLQPMLAGPRPSAGAVVLAIVIGAMTHVAWDGFTHAGDWGVRLVPFLRDHGLVLGGRVVAWYRVVQHLSTAVGGAVVAAWLASWWRSLDVSVRRAAIADAGPIVRAAVVVLLAAACGAVLNGARGLAAGPTYVLGLAAVGAMDGAIAGVLGLAWFDRRRAAATVAIE